MESMEGQMVALGRRQNEGEMRLSSEVMSVARAVADVRDLLLDRRDHRHRIDDHERRITALEAKVN